jgi:hypothetical protein
MIVGNGVRLSGNPNRFFGTADTYVTARSTWNKRGALLNIFTQPTVSKKDGIPSGMRHPQVWLLPVKPGGLSSRFYAVGTSDLVGSVAGGRAATAALAGVGTVSTADATLLGFLTGVLVGQAGGTATAKASGAAIATLAGSGQVSADVSSVLNMLANLAGSGDITTASAAAYLAATALLQGTGSVSAFIAGAVAADASLGGSGSVSSAVLNAITRAVAAISGVGTLEPPTLQGFGLATATVPGVGSFAASADAKGSMTADISLSASGAALSPESVASSVRTALMGTTLDGYTLEQIIKLTSATLLGKSSGGATNPVFRSIDDTADRVSGEVDGVGNRTASVLSP